MVPMDRIALVVGRLSAAAAMILCLLWVSGEDEEEGYLGGLDAYDPKGKNVFSWHAVLMVGGIVCLSGWSITAYRMRVFGYTTTRNLHVFFHLGAKVCLTIGVKAAWDYKDLDQDDDNPAYLVHMGSFHAMLGLATTILLVQNDMLGSIVFLVPSIPSRFRILYKPHHMFFGKAAYIVAMLTVVSGITEKQTYISCLPSRPNREQDATKTYGKLSGDNCAVLTTP
jgi:cytochrome b-561